MKILLWLDDMRDPFLGDWLLSYAPDFGDNRENVVWVKNYEDFITWITDNGLPYKVAFDHDLGQDVADEKVENGMSKRKSRKEKKGIKDGKDAANWMVDYCLDNGKDIPFFTIQSANPTGADNIRGLLLGAMKHINKI